MRKTNEKVQIDKIEIQIPKNLVDEVLKLSGKKNVSKVIENLIREEIEIQKKYIEIKNNT